MLFLPELLALDDAGFRDRFGTTAVARTKRIGLARNAAVVLGNTLNPAAIEPLGRALREDPSALVRAHAAWGLGRIGGPAAVKALDGTERREPPPVEAEVATARKTASASRQ